MCRKDRRCAQARRLESLSASDVAPRTQGAPELFWSGEDLARVWKAYDSPVVCVAVRRVEVAAQADAQVFEAMAEVAAGCGVRLHGAEFRLKAPSSMARKVEDRQTTAAQQGRQISAAEAAESITDVCRYTALTEEHDRIPEVAREVVEGLASRGWSVQEAEQSYVEGNSYKGVHLLMREPEGSVVEVQVHSERSQAIKDQSHVPYERSRAAETPMGERRALQDECRRLWADAPVPRGLEEMGALGGVSVRKKAYS